MNATVEAAQSVQFARVFGERLILAEQPLLQGLQISRFSFVRASTASGIRLSVSQQSPNRTAEGGALDIFARPGLTLVELQSWAERAAPAAQAALAKLLSLVTASPAGVQLVVSIIPVLVLSMSQYVQVQFDIFVQVPPMKSIADDPDGKLYQDLARNYSLTIATLRDSAQFAALLDAELASRRVVRLLGMSFSPILFSSPGEDVVSAAGGEIIPLGIAGLVIVFLLVACTRNSLQRMRVYVCFCCRRSNKKEDPWNLRRKLGAELPRITKIMPMDDKEAVEVCICGQWLEGCVCKWCGRKDTDIARERYMETGAAAVQNLGLDGFDPPQTPGGSAWKLDRLAAEKTKLMDLIGESTSCMLYFEGAVRSQSARSLRLAANSFNSPMKKVAEDMPEDHDLESTPLGGPLQAEAQKLRVAMGGSPHTPSLFGSQARFAGLPRSQTGSTGFSADSEIQRLESGTLQTSRTLESVRSPSVVDLCSPERTRSFITPERTRSFRSVARSRSLRSVATDRTRTPPQPVTTSPSMSPTSRRLSPSRNAPMLSPSMSSGTTRRGLTLGVFRSPYSPDIESSSSSEEMVISDVSDGDFD